MMMVFYVCVGQQYRGRFNSERNMLTQRLGEKEKVMEEKPRRWGRHREGERERERKR